MLNSPSIIVIYTCTVYVQSINLIAVSDIIYMQIKTSTMKYIVILAIYLHFIKQRGPWGLEMYIWLYV